MATVAELLDGHVSLDLACVDQLYLNGYIPSLATGAGLTRFLRERLGKPIPSLTVFVNHYYVDGEDVGPALVKVCSCASWALKVFLNGHEWA